jgi:hypothetical protein
LASTQRGPEFQRWPNGGMLDCTRDEVESRLSQRLTIDVNPAASFCAIDTSDMPAKNTAEELNGIHSRSKFQGRKICSAIEERYKTVLEQYDHLLQLLQQFNGSWTHGEVCEQRDVVRQMLSRQAPYAALIRNRYRDFVEPSWHQLLGL